MAKKDIWEEYKKINGIGFEETQEEIKKHKLVSNLNYKKDAEPKEKNKYYSTTFLKLDPQKIAKRVDDLEKSIDLAQRRREIFCRKRN